MGTLVLKQLGRKGIGWYSRMPRQPRLDAPGTLHHVMAGGLTGLLSIQKWLSTPEPIRRVRLRVIP